MSNTAKNKTTNNNEWAKHIPSLMQELGGGLVFTEIREH